ncbi:MAG: NAD(P)/FAD-dependent oxidoreductase, partial [Cyanobacteria bacterium]|nr:NAD(P)/FAD-dependent oxidoreductase [Cyanobacteriota bacterium]
MRIAIIGAGHNGLVCAAYIARNGHEVVVYERNDRVGGLCVTEELFPGFKVSTLATHFGALRKEIMDDLTLQAFGLKAYLNDPASVVMFSGHDEHHFVRARSGSCTFNFDVSEEDNLAWTRFWAEISQAAAILSPFLLRTGVTQYELGEEIRAAGLKSLAEKLFDGCLSDYVEERFKSTYLKAAICSTVFEVPTKKGTVFDCLYYATGQACGIPGAVGLVRGGMGSVTHSLRLVCQSQGVEIRTSTAVKRVLIEGTRAWGVELGDG